MHGTPVYGKTLAYISKWGVVYGEDSYDRLMRTNGIAFFSLLLSGVALSAAIVISDAKPTPILITAISIFVLLAFLFIFSLVRWPYDMDWFIVDNVGDHNTKKFNLLPKELRRGALLLMTSEYMHVRIDELQKVLSLSPEDPKRIRTQALLTSLTEENSGEGQTAMLLIVKGLEGLKG